MIFKNFYFVDPTLDRGELPNDYFDGSSPKRALSGLPACCDIPDDACYLIRRTPSIIMTFGAKRGGSNGIVRNRVTRRLGIWAMPVQGSSRFSLIPPYLRHAWENDDKEIRPVIVAPCNSTMMKKVEEIDQLVPVELGGVRCDTAMAFENLSEIDLYRVEIRSRPDGGQSFGFIDSSLNGNRGSVSLSECVLCGKEYSSENPDYGGSCHVRMKSSGMVSLHGNRVRFSPGEKSNCSVELGEVSGNFICRNNDVVMSADCPEKKDSTGYPGSGNSSLFYSSLLFNLSSAEREHFVFSGNHAHVLYCGGFTGRVPSVFGSSANSSGKVMNVICEGNSLDEKPSSHAILTDSMTVGRMFAFPVAKRRLVFKGMSVNLPSVSRISSNGIMSVSIDRGQWNYDHVVDGIEISLGTAPFGKPYDDDILCWGEKEGSTITTSYYALYLNGVRASGVVVFNCFGNGIYASGCDVSGSEIGGRIYLTGSNLSCVSCTGKARRSALNLVGVNLVSIGSLEVSSEFSGDIVTYGKNGDQGNSGSMVNIVSCNAMIRYSGRPLGGTPLSCMQNGIQIGSDGTAGRFSLYSEKGLAMTWNCIRAGSRYNGSIRMMMYYIPDSSSPLIVGHYPGYLTLSEPAGKEGDYHVVGHIALYGADSPNGLVEYQIDVSSGMQSSAMDGRWVRDKGADWGNPELHPWKWETAVHLKKGECVRGRMLYFSSLGPAVCAYLEPGVDLSECLSPDCRRVVEFTLDDSDIVSWNEKEVIIRHNLDFLYPAVSLYDVTGGGCSLSNFTVRVVDSNSVCITMPDPVGSSETWRAVFSCGKPQERYRKVMRFGYDGGDGVEADKSSNLIRFRHGMGCIPIATLYDGDDRIAICGFHFEDENTATVELSDLVNITGEWKAVFLRGDEFSCENSSLNDDGGSICFGNSDIEIKSPDGSDPVIPGAPVRGEVKWSANTAVFSHCLKGYPTVSVCDAEMNQALYEVVSSDEDSVSIDFNNRDNIIGKWRVLFALD